MAKGSRGHGDQAPVTAVRQLKEAEAMAAKRRSESEIQAEERRQKDAQAKKRQDAIIL